MLVLISKLPAEIQKRIPYSIRSFKDAYDLDELPRKEREMIKEYFEKVVKIEYESVIDFVPKISKYADLLATGNVKTTVVEYLKNYLYTMPGDYPFDPEYGCGLKQLLHQKDTAQVQLLIREEINKIVRLISSDLNIKIIVNNVSIEPITDAALTMYKCKVSIKIPGEEDVTLIMEPFDNY